MLETFKDFFSQVQSDLKTRGSFWSPTLGTVSKTGSPEMRTVILRDFMAEYEKPCIQLFFHTDRRSQKCTEFDYSSLAGLHFYCSKRRWQMRIKGEVTQVLKESERQNHWHKLSPTSQKLYSTTKGAGTEVNSFEESLELSKEDTAFENFGLFKFNCTSLESLKILEPIETLPHHQRTILCLKTNHLRVLVP